MKNHLVIKRLTAILIALNLSSAFAAETSQTITFVTRDQQAVYIPLSLLKFLPTLQHIIDMQGVAQPIESNLIDTSTMQQIITCLQQLTQQPPRAGKERDRYTPRQLQPVANALLQ